MYNRLRIIYVISLAIIIGSIMGLINTIISIFISFKTFNSDTVNINSILNTSKLLLPLILVIVILSIIIIICKKYYKSSREELTLKYNLFFVGVYLIISRLNVIFYMLIRLKKLIKTVKFSSQEEYISQLALDIPQIVILMIRRDIRQNKVVSIGEGDE